MYQYHQGWKQSNKVFDVPFKVLVARAKKLLKKGLGWKAVEAKLNRV